MKILNFNYVTVKKFNLSKLCKMAFQNLIKYKNI